jgi:hypothetical protein
VVDYADWERIMREVYLTRSILTPEQRTRTQKALRSAERVHDSKAELGGEHEREKTIVIDTE